MITIAFCALSAVGKVFSALSESPESHRQKAYNEAVIASNADERKVVEHHTNAAYAHMLAAELKDSQRGS